MKNFILISFCLILSSMQLKGQSQDLLDNTWYLERLVIDQVDYFTPDNDEINQITLEFEIDFIYSSPFPSGCFGYAGEILFDDNQMSFSTDDASSTFPECVLQENMEFYAIYIDEFYWVESGNATEVFFYEITEESSTLKKLTITNTNGDQAVYYSETLSILDENEFSSVKLYPNPTHNKFSVNTDVSIDQIKIYNLTGQIVLRFEREALNSTYDISSLSSGLYFVKIISSKGNKTVRKLIKQ